MFDFLKKYFICLSVLLLAAALDAAPAAKNENTPQVNSILASVNGKPISLSDVLPMTRNREFQLYAAYSGKRLEEAIKELRRQAVDDLIDRELIYADYQKSPHRVSNADIENEIDRFAERLGCRSRDDLRKKLRAANMSFEDIQKKVTQEVCVQYMIFGQVSIAGDPTPKEVYEYFVANNKSLNDAAKLELGMLKLPLDHPDIGKLSAALKKNPGDFSKLAAEYNPGTPDGRIGIIECSKLRHEFAKALTDYTKGKVFGPIKIEDAVVWLKIIDYIPAKIVKYSDAAAKIKTELKQKNSAQAIKKYALRLRQNALVEYFF